LLTPFKSLMAMNSDCHVSLRGFFEFFSFYFYFFNYFKKKIKLIFFLNVHVSTQERATCHFVVFLNFLFYLFFKCSRVNPVVYHVSKSIFYIQFGPYICYFCSIKSQFLLTLTNLDPIEDVTKINFYIKVVMI